MLEKGQRIIAQDVIDTIDLNSGASGLEVGDIGIAVLPIDESKLKRRYLNGQKISQAQFQMFTKRLKQAVQTYPNLATTESGWQYIKSHSRFGQVGKFVIDDTDGTIRLPCIVKLQGVLNLSNIGKIVDESLPNIKGEAGKFGFDHEGNKIHNGAFEVKNALSTIVNGHSGDQWVHIWKEIHFDASLWSSTYQDYAPVQEEAIQYPYFIQVANGVEEEIKITVVDYEGITNCITEIPQDIKLELNNGVLTLKAGSKVYVPNGFESDGVTRKFDVITIESDKTWTNSENRPFILSININTQNIWGNWSENTMSGNVEPPNTFFGFFYNADSNLIYDYRGGDGRNFQAAFPICIVTSNTTQIISIDQVFNGFGYIGSTVFALPGVKGLIPDGRNEDGSLKSIECSSSSVSTYTVSSASDNYKYSLAFDGSIYPFYKNLIYKEDENRNYSNNIPSSFVDVGYVMYSNSKISNFSPKLPFRAVDYNDFTDALNSKLDTKLFKVVDSLPATPDEDVFYFILE